MDPATIGSLEWSEIGKLLTGLWIVVLFIVLFATNMLLAHNFIPSLVASGHLQNSLQKTRVVLYALALVCFGLAIFFLSGVVDSAGVLRDLFPDYWI